MRTKLHGALVAIAMFFGPVAAMAQADPVTAAAFIEGSRSAMSSVASKARAEGQTLLVDAAVHASGILDRLEQLLGKQVNQPIQRLTETLQNEVAAARFVVDAVRTTADQLPRCIGNEVDIAMAGLKSGVFSALGSLPISDGAAYAYLIKQPSSRSPYVVTRDPSEPADISLIMQGANLWQQAEICEISAQAVPFDKRNKTRPIKVKFSDREKVHLALESSVENGEWLVQVTAKRRRFALGCLVPEEETVSAAVKVVAPVTASYTVKVAPSCAGYSECRKPFNGSCTNGSKRDDKNCTQIVDFGDPACEYVRVDEWSAGGRSGNVSAPRRVNNTIVIQATADRRSRSKGGTSRQAWSGVLVGRKPVDPVTQDRIDIPLPARISRGGSVPFHVKWEAPQHCEVNAWILGGTGTFTDGKPVATPDLTILNLQSGTTVQGGIKSTLNTRTLDGTVEFSGAGCL